VGRGTHEQQPPAKPTPTDTLASKLSASFSPAHFIALIERECIWFELLMRLVRHRVNYPESFEAQIISGMIQDRTDWLRN
jgi:hypothetical protein